MAENKRSFLLYADIIHTVKKLPKDKAGELFMTILEYVNDLNPEVNDMAVDLVFEPIKQQLKRDLKHWEVVKNVRSESGKIGGLKSGESRRNKANEANALSNEANEANEAVNVTVNDSVINSGVDVAKASRIILKDFGFNEVANFDKLTLISRAITFIVSQGRHEYFQKQYFNYLKFKNQSKERKQSIETFFGTKNNYENPGWDSNSWEDLLKSSNYINPAKGAAN